MTGDELHQILQRLGWNDSVLSATLDLDNRLVRRWHNGQRVIPDNVADLLLRIDALISAWRATRPQQKSEDSP